MADEIGNELASLILKKEWGLEMVIKSDKSQKDKLHKIKTLVATYSQAIEYYQSIESDLYVDLNLRMQQLLIRPEILELLDREAEINSGANHRRSTDTESADEDLIPKPQSSKMISPRKPTEQPLSFSGGDGRRLESPDTQDSTSVFESMMDQRFASIGDEREADYSRATFWVKDTQPLDNSGLALSPTSIKSKMTANFDVPEDHSNEFVYHRGDRRNRHGVSFKVCKNRQDGALIRPKLPPKTEDKKEIHSTMLNENNDDINSTPRVYATREILEEFTTEEESRANFKVIEKDMHEQESALKIRLLKRENQLNQKRKGNNSSNDSGRSGSPTKSKSDIELNF